MKCIYIAILNKSKCPQNVDNNETHIKKIKHKNTVNIKNNEVKTCACQTNILLVVKAKE